MIVGIGLDIVATAAVRDLLAARFAAKEACFKALGTLTHSAGVAAAAVILEGGG